MATAKVGIYRSYYGSIPKNSSGKPLPKCEWPKKRPHSWVVRWFGYDGQRYSRSCTTRKEAERLAEEKQKDVRVGQSDEPRKLTLKEFGDMYLSIRTDLTERCIVEHKRVIRFLRERPGDNRPIQRVTPLDARSFIAWYRKRQVRGVPLTPATVNKVLRECRRIFREAVDCHFIKSNPFDGMRPLKVGESPWHFVTPVEFHALMDATDSRGD